MAAEDNKDVSEELISFSDPAPSEILKKVAEIELGETEEVKAECLKKLRTLINVQNLVCIDSDDFLLRFLRAKKFDINRSFEALRKYAHYRVAFNGHLLKLNPEVVKTILRHNVFGYLPYRDDEGRCVFYCRTGIWNHDMCSSEELLITTFLLANYIVEDPSSQITGIVGLFDGKCFTTADMTFIIGQAKYIKQFLLNCLPARYPKIHVINEFFGFYYFYRLLKSFISKKIMDRFMIHGKNREVFFQHIPPNILPDDFDGNLGPLNTNSLLEVMDDYLAKIRDEQRYFLEQDY